MKLRLPGVVRDRGDVVRTALLVGIPLVIVFVVWASQPRPYYTGSNSIRTRDFVAGVKADETLCIRDLHLPAETALIEFEMVLGAPRPALRLDVRTPAGALIERSRLPGISGGAYRRDAERVKIAFPIKQRPKQPASVPVSACLTPQRVILLGGTLGSLGQTPTLDGEPIADQRIGVWYRPPAGSERSLLQQVPVMFERATLFRPPWVGRWTYWLLLGLVLPMTFALALFLLIRAQTLSWRRLGGGVFAVTLGIALSWTLVTPPFQAPDEQDHFAYVQQLAENGKAASQTAEIEAWSTQLRIALQETRALAANEQADGRAPWLERDERVWAQRDDGGKASRMDGGGPTTAATHGPVYYGVMTVPYRIAGGASIWSQLELMRIFSALLCALTVLFVLLAAREVAPQRPLLAVGAALVVALNPMFTFIGASVNNDVGVNAAAALFLFLVLRAARRGLTVPLALGLGATLGVLPVIKGTSYALYVVAALALLALLAHRRDRKVLAGIAATVVAVVLVQILWSQIAGGFGRTTFTTPGGGAPIAAGSLWESVGSTLGYLWQIFLPPLPSMYDHYPSYPLPGYVIYVVRGWASFGWYTIEFPQIVYEAIIAGLAGTVVCGLAFARRRWAWVRANWVIVLTLVLTPVIVVVAVERAFATPGTRKLIAEMGRYLFPAIGALGILAAGAWHAWGERWAARITTAVLVSLMVLTFASQLLTLGGFYT